MFLFYYVKNKINFFKFYLNCLLEIKTHSIQTKIKIERLKIFINIKKFQNFLRIFVKLTCHHVLFAKEQTLRNQNALHKIKFIGAK